MTEELRSQAKQLEEEIKSLDDLIQHETMKIKWEHEQIDESDTIEKIVEKLQDEMAKIEQQIKLDGKERKNREELLEKAQNIYYMNQTLEQKFSEYEQLRKEKKEVERKTPIIEERKSKR